jgi:starch synthase
VAPLKAPIDYIKLTKLAIDFSDGIIMQSPHINEEILEYARAAGKPFLDYHNLDEMGDACNDFYDEVWEKDEAIQA